MRRLLPALIAAAALLTTGCGYTGDPLPPLANIPARVLDLAAVQREIPMDPITTSNQTWKIIMEDATQSVNQSEPGIFDVRSGSDKIGPDGTQYSDW